MICADRAFFCWKNASGIPSSEESSKVTMSKSADGLEKVMARSVWDDESFLQRNLLQVLYEKIWDSFTTKIYLLEIHSPSQGLWDDPWIYYCFFDVLLGETSSKEWWASERGKTRSRASDLLSTSESPNKNAQKVSLSTCSKSSGKRMTRLKCKAYQGICFFHLTLFSWQLDLIPLLSESKDKTGHFQMTQSWDEWCTSLPAQQSTHSGLFFTDF